MLNTNSSPTHHDSKSDVNGNGNKTEHLRITFLHMPHNNMERYENVRKQGFYQKFFVCELLKNEGNGHYNRHQPLKALEAYLRALSIFLKRCPLNQGGSNNGHNDHGSHEPEIRNGSPKGNVEEHQVSLVIENEDGKSEKERTLFKKLKLSLFLNLSQCYLLLHDYDNAYHAANYALLLAPRNEKALFRQAKAIVSMENPGKDMLQLAIKNLNRSQQQAPEEKAVIQQVLMEAAKKLDTLIKMDYMKRCDGSQKTKRKGKSQTPVHGGIPMGPNHNDFKRGEFPKQQQHYEIPFPQRINGNNNPKKKVIEEIWHDSEKEIMKELIARRYHCEVLREGIVTVTTKNGEEGIISYSDGEEDDQENSGNIYYEDEEEVNSEDLCREDFPDCDGINPIAFLGCEEEIEFVMANRDFDLGNWNGYPGQMGQMRKVKTQN